MRERVGGVEVLPERLLNDDAVLALCAQHAARGMGG